MLGATQDADEHLLGDDTGGSLSDYERAVLDMPKAPKRGRVDRRLSRGNEYRNHGETGNSWFYGEADKPRRNASPAEKARCMTGWWDKCQTVNHDHALKELGCNAVARSVSRRSMMQMYIKVDEETFALRSYSPVELYRMKVPFDGQIVEQNRRDGYPGKCRQWIEGVRHGEIKIHMDWDNPKGGENHQLIRYDPTSKELIMTNRVKLNSPARKNGPTETTYSVIFSRSQRRNDDPDFVLGEEDSVA